MISETATGRNPEQPINTVNTPDQVTDGCSRQTGRAVLNDLIHRLRRKADNLQKLSDMLPEKPTPEQDEALWGIAVEMERR